MNYPDERCLSCERYAKILDDYIDKNGADIVKNRLTESEIKELLSRISFVPGIQLLDFMKKYSYLAREEVEFFGLSKILMEKSNLYEVTKLLHKNYPSTKGYYVIFKDGPYYVLVDSEDRIYDFFTDFERPEPRYSSFYLYIIERFYKTKP